LLQLSEKEPSMNDETKQVTDVARYTTGSNLPTVNPEKLVGKRKLTMDATSISRLGQVVCQVTGEMEVIQMPAVGAGNGKSDAVAVPIIDLLQKVDYLLICNSLIVSAFQRAGTPLAGRYFAIRSGEIKAGKRYRSVDIVELQLAE
jgi:hypothetical protein